MIMAVGNHSRNYAGVEFETLRLKMDPLFASLHDELEVAYYDYWKLGKSQSFFQWDVLPTAEENKQQFDLLQGALFSLYLIALEQVNARQDKYDMSKYLGISDSNGNVVGSRIDHAKQWLISFAQSQSVDVTALRDEFKARVKAATNVNVVY